MKANLSSTRRKEKRKPLQNVMLGACSLVIHLAILLLIPGITVQARETSELIIELVIPPLRTTETGAQRPAGPVIENPAAGETPSPEPEEPTSDKPSALRSTPAPTTKPTPEPVTETSPTPQADVPVAAPRPDTALESTDVDLTPLTVEESPVEVAPTPPVVPAPEEVVDVPVAVAEETIPTASAEVTQKVEQPVAAPATDGNGTGPADTDEATGDTAAASSEDSSGDETAPPAPPGPSAGELSELAGYGDNALKRIAGQARNAEAGARGTVHFAFEVSRDGHLIDVWIVTTSGHILLDTDVLEAARAAFNEAHEIKAFPADTTVESWVFERDMDYPRY